MRLVDFGQVETYQPPERGDSFPHLHENGDRFRWYNHMMWTHAFWRFLMFESRTYYPTHDEVSMLIMGGEL